MKETGIIFAPESVQKTVEHLKNQTRRVLEPQPPADTLSIYPAFPGEKTLWFDCLRDETAATNRFKSKFGGVGDLLWVREEIKKDATGFFRYSDGTTVSNTHPAGRLRDKYSARFMPRWACRLELIITDLRCERVQEISEEDAKAEGMEMTSSIPPSYVLTFQHRWNEINGKREGGQFTWNSNPWLLVIKYDIYSWCGARCIGALN